MVRGLAAVAVGGAAQAAESAGTLLRASPAAGFAVLAATADLAPAPAAAAAGVILGAGEYRYRVVEGWG
ncbi:MAG: hypothetical protein M0Z28_32540, partial [Rhodospirillales bacterium]|nr:hypothetical protein [Rhodospirillales bacterium]